jgi:hypothetical protein
VCSTCGQPAPGSVVVSTTSASQSSKASRSTARYSSSFDGKWWKRLGVRIPTASAISARLVPAYPFSAKR